MQVRARARGAAALFFLLVALLLGRPYLERRLQDRIEGEARRRGVALHLDAVRLGVWPPVALLGLTGVDRRWSWRVESAEARLGLGHWRLDLGRLVASGDDTVVTVPETRWDFTRRKDAGWRADLREPAQGLLVERSGDRLEIQADGLPAGRLFGLRHKGAPLVDPGTVTGRASFTRAAGSTAFGIRVESRGLRLVALGGDPHAFGAPTDVEAYFDGLWRPDAGALDVTRWSARLDAAELEGTLVVADWHADPSVDLTLDVRRVEFARLLRASGVGEPVAGNADLGAASLTARANGRLGDPASFTVTQRLDFRPPRTLPPALVRLRGDFEHEVTLADGSRRAILVSAESPDYVRMRDVPPLFVRTLLLAEDAGFYGHRGVDLQELPSALLLNWEKGGAVRGASTLTQQLAKNLFLSRERRLSRKLQELPLALLLEATLDKERLLEIYLNIIEWGKDLHGLRPAARRYFRVEPAALRPVQMAFLVTLIPSPVRYEAALKDGVPTVRLRTLVDDLLLKLRSVGAISEDELQSALQDDLVVAEPAPAGETAKQPLA